MIYPRLPYKGDRVAKKLVDFRGINVTENYKEGELEDSEGITSEKYPVLMPRKGREIQATYASVTDIFEWDGKMVVVSAGSLWFDGVRIVNVTDTPKQYAVVNTHLIVMPDGIDIDMESDTTSESGERSFTFKYLKSKYTTATPDDSSLTTSDWSSGKNIKANPITLLSTERLYGMDQQYHLPWDNWTPPFIGPCVYTYGTDAAAVSACWKDDHWDLDALADIQQLAAICATQYKEYIDSNTKQFLYSTESRLGDLVVLSGDLNSYGLVTTTNTTESKNLPDTSQYGTEGLYARFVSASKYTYTTEGWEVSTFVFDIYSAKTANKLFSAFFEVGDYVSCTNQYDSAYSFDHAKVTAINDSSNTMTVNLYDETAGTWTAAAFSTTSKSFKGGLVIQKDYPSLDYVCEKGNRLWGVSNEDKTIYASALGLPRNMYDFDSLDTDSYSVAVGSEGDFTGIANYGDAVICFKENTIHKILGDYPSNFYMSQYKVDGVQKGSYKSLCNINEVLYYKGVNGVYAYTGSSPSLISSSLGRDVYHAAVGGSDGQRYYISMHDADENELLFVYDLHNGLWIKEDDIYVDAFTKLSGVQIDDQVMDQFYFCSDGVLYRANVDNDETFEWFAEFKPFLTYTTSSSSYSRSFGKQGLTKLTLMLDMTKGSRISVKVKEDDSRWKTVKTIVASTKKAEIVPIRLGRCEYVHIRLEGKGNVILRGLERSYVVGSEV